ncbi:MAG: ParA family protein [candidate division WOR-3 bacterium]
MGKSVSIVNQKGGVGKTTTAVNLGAALALYRQSCLIIDMDPQSNATSGQGLTGVTPTIYDVLVKNKEPESVIKKFILIDAPPSLGLLTVNSLVGADSVLIPIQAEFYAMEGLSKLLNTVRNIQRELNSRLTIEGVLLTLFDTRLNLAHEVTDEVCKYFGDKVFEVIIPRNVKLAEAPSYGKHIFDYDPGSRGAEVYKMLAEEVIRRNGKTGAWQRV